MRALVITGTGGPEVLSLRDVPDVRPGASEMSVRVRAAALNRADLLQLRGHYPAPPGAPQDIPGLEYAGEVLSVGEAVTRFKPGDRVMGVVGGGAFAEALVVHEREAIPIPERLTFEQAAAVPEAFITAFDALVVQGGLGAGEWVLIHSAASGVGTAAVQIVQALGARAIGTSRSQDKLDRLRHELGLQHTLRVDEACRFADAVRALTGHGADLVLELVAGRYLPESLASLAPRGRLMLVGLLAGARAEIDLRLVLSKRLRLTGTVLRSRPIEEKIAAARSFERHLLPLFEVGRLRPIVDRAWSFEEARTALDRLAADQSFGKIVLRW